MRTLIAAVLLAAACNVDLGDPIATAEPAADPMEMLIGPRATCGALCGSQAFCSQPPTTCRYCNGGMCSFVPLTPGPPPGDDDAGVVPEPDAQ